MLADYVVSPDKCDGTKLQVDMGTHLTTSISDDHWEMSGASHIACWEQACACIGDWTFELDSESYLLSVDWSPALAHVRHNYSVRAELQAVMGTPAVSAVLDKFSNDPVLCEVAFSSHAQPSSRIAESLVECFLYDFFLMMNLASPAACDLFGARLHKNRPIRLSNYVFEMAMLESADGNWPRTAILPLPTVMKWYRSVRTSAKLVPRNRMERVLFAVLHLAKSEISPSSVVWVFYALETLFDTKAGENFRSLISRIVLLLQPEAGELVRLRKKLRELYDIRSSFVHGGMDVVHPMHDEILDRDVDAIHSRIMDAVDFGTQLIVASIQEVIRRGWPQPSFHEILAGAQEAGDG